MISQQKIENVLNKKIYDDILWEYDDNLIQIIKISNNKKLTYNLVFNNLKEKYDLMFFLNEKEDDFKGYCNCKKGKDGKNCEHLVWGLLKINKDLKNKIEIERQENTEGFKLDILKNLASFSFVKDEVYIEFEILSFLDNEISFQIKANINKFSSYKIKNIEKFINEIKDSKKLEYGKNFITSNYEINKKQMDLFFVLDYINLKLKADNKSINNAMLDYKMFLLLLNSLTNEYIKIKNEDYYVLDEIKNINMYVNYKNDDEVDIEFMKNNDYKILNSNIVINDVFKTLHILSDRDLDKLKILKKLGGSIKNNSMADMFKYKISLSKEDTKEFKQNILPKIYNEFEVTLDKRLGLNVITDKFKAEIFCYKESKKICIEPHFLYGEYDTYNNESNVLITRNKQKEQMVLNYFTTRGYEYDAYAQRFIIENKRTQYTFLTEDLLELKENYNVNIDNKLKDSILNFDSSSINLNIKKDEKVDFFEIEFDIPNIKIKEIDSILKSFEEKKVFYVLDDDTFLKLNDKKIYDQLLFIKDVIKDESYKLNSYRIPQYKALQLDVDIKNKFNRYKISQSFLNYIESIKIITPLKNEYLENENYKLRKYQKEGVSWLSNLYEAKLGALLADEMGLGKTLQTIAFLNVKKIKSALIIVPKALLYNWVQEFEKFSPTSNIVIVDGIKSKRNEYIREISKDTIVLTSYNSIVNDCKLYENIYFDTIIIDEAQYIKNPTTKTSRCVKTLKGSFFIALTGTPIQNHLLEIWSIFDFILPGYFSDLNTFKKKYKIEEEITNLKILKESSAPFILRRLKEEVLKELPDKIQTNLLCQLEDEQKVLYAKYNEKLKKEIESYIYTNTQKNKSIEILSGITRLRQLALSPKLVTDAYKKESCKIQVFEELINDIISAEEKVLVFSQYTSLLSLLKEKLEELQIKFYYLDGKTRPRDRLKDVEKFNKNNIPVYLISLKAGGVGLNLTSAKNVIIMDPWWNPAIEEQAIDRTHRIGQENKVQVYRIISKGTIEEKILTIKKNKKKIVEQVLENDIQDITKMNTDELISLLQI